jgi:hypothetical protein
MKPPRFLLLCMALLSALWLGTAQALPNVDEVQAAVQRGDYPGAEKMMREVVAARPDSPRAHYVLAEILAHQRQFNEAGEHVRRARALDPALKFADSAKFTAFEQLLQRQQAATAKSTVPAALEPAPEPNAAAPVPRAERAERVERAGSFGGVPIWLLVAGVILFIGLAVRFMRRRTAAQSQPAFAGGGYGPGAGMGGMGYGGGTPQASSGGPGMLGVGLGVAGGVAAGMLAERMLNGSHGDPGLARDASAGGAGGLIPGSFGGGDPGAADELTHRDIDFGSGDGWGGGDAGGDMGGSSDDW